MLDFSIRGDKLSVRLNSLWQLACHIRWGWLGLSHSSSPTAEQGQPFPMLQTLHQRRREEGTAACLAQGVALNVHPKIKKEKRKKRRRNSQNPYSYYSCSAQTSSTNRSEQSHCWRAKRSCLSYYFNNEIADRFWKWFASIDHGNKPGTDRGREQLKHENKTR